MIGISKNTINLFLLLTLCLVVNSCQGQSPIVQPPSDNYDEVQRTKEFDEIYYVLLSYFEEEKGEISDYCLYFTRTMIVKWEDHPNTIGHAGYKPGKNWCRIILDDRLSGWQLITVMTHEMAHIIYWCYTPPKERSEKIHGDDTVWANGGGDFDVSKFCKDPSIEIGKIKKDSILFKAAFELVCLDHNELMGWTRSEGRQTDMKIHEDSGVPEQQ